MRKPIHRRDAENPETNSRLNTEDTEEAQRSLRKIKARVFASGEWLNRAKDVCRARYIVPLRKQRQETGAVRDLRTEVFGDGLAHVGERGADAEIHAAGRAGAVR